MISSRYLNLMKRICALAEDNNRRIFLVGGVVRDLLRGVPPGDADVDFCVDVSGVEFAQVCAQSLKGVAKSFPQFLTAKILAPAEAPEIAEIDFTTARRETYRKPGALPDVAPATIDEDLQRRDFTINAMALPAEKVVALSERGGLTTDALRAIALDPLQGRADLDKKIVRVLHEKSFIDDPTRIFRACRYAVRIGGECSKETTEGIFAAIQSGALKTVSPQRKLNEMKHVVEEPDPGEVVQLLVNFGVLRSFQIFDPLNVGMVRTALVSLRNARGPISNDLREKAALRIFYACADRSIRESVFEELALGRKIMKHIHDDVMLLDSDLPLNSLTVEGLLCIATLSKERGGDATKALTAQGIHVIHP